MSQNNNYHTDNRPEHAPGYFPQNPAVLHRFHYMDLGLKLIDVAISRIAPVEQTTAKLTQTTPPVLDTVPLQNANQLDVAELGQQANAIAEVAAKTLESLDVQ